MERKEGEETTAGEVEGTPWLLLPLRVWAVAEADAEAQLRSQRAQKAFLCQERTEGGGGARCCCYIIMAEAGTRVVFPPLRFIVVGLCNVTVISSCEQ